jgi:hypothetical protein
MPGRTYNVYNVGMRKLKDRIAIGGDKRKADIYVEGLKPVEFYVETQRGNSVLVDAGSGAVRGAFKDQPSGDLRTSNKDIKLRIGLEGGKLKCR